MGFLDRCEPRERDADLRPPALDHAGIGALAVARAVADADVLSPADAARLVRSDLAEAERRKWIEAGPGGWRATPTGRRELLIHADPRGSRAGRAA